ncbi:MAG: Eco57I restriction-modification methylase domain-containing protein [Clostridia bacterium]|nr:Eco57I restriction-modification methylase domain-containing protein [Clostridia bacterium]
MSDNGLFEKVYNPDVLSCLANLSNDEVFTPPEIVNQMLDMLPQELFKNPDTKFLDPACKTGVFLREIAKRLIKGLERQMPDLQQRVDHIFKNQLYGIAITELTSLLSRRGVYCSKYANSDFAVTKFDTADGNIRYKRIPHTWKDGRCIYCGANKEQYDRGDELETHAYEFIHTLNAEEIFNMKFDVIISNPPYQLSDGGAQASAKPIYQRFIRQAKKLKPRYLTMIIPARWMTGGKGLDDFRDEMIHDRHITKLYDFADSSDCFNGVEIKGGVCYFLWDKSKESECEIYRQDANGVIYSKRYLAEEGDDIFIRYPQLVSIKNKVSAFKEKSFEDIVSSRKPYGLASDFFVNPAKFKLPPISDEPIKGGYSILGLAGLRRIKKYIPQNYPLPKKDGIDKYKLFISNSYGCGEIGEGPATPGELCTETFLEIGGWDNKTQAENALSYLKTKFFRCLVGIRKQTQHATKNVYHYVPMQDFSKAWTDEELYKKYNLTQEEIDFIESMIKPME